MRAWTGLVVTLWLVLAGAPAGAEPSPGGTFWDDDESVHQGSIEAIAAAGITVGCAPPDLYCPDREVTRGEMAAFLRRSTGLAAADGDRFVDDDDSIFRDDIEAIAAAGITRGCGVGRFCPDRPVTREEMAAFLKRAFSLPSGPPAAFTDDDGSIFEADIDSIAVAGITHGCGAGKYCPRAPVTRSEMASFLTRALELAELPPPPRPSIEVALTGDVLIHPGVSARAGRYGTPYDFRPMYAEVRERITAADVALCHLEVPLSPDNRDLSGYPTFNAPRQVAEAQLWAGYDGCSTASNHSFDQGEAGIAATLEVLEEVGIGHAGMATGESEAGRATFYPVEGVEVAHLSATWWLNGFRLPPARPWLVQMLDVPDLLSQAARARADGADIVIVSMHCCVEYQVVPTVEQRRIAHALIRSPDVDLVVGHHAHVVQPIEEVDGEYVVYGLGNFLSGQRLRPATQDGVMVTVEFAPRQGGWSARGVEALPTWVEAGSYRILPATGSSWRRTHHALTLYRPSHVSVLR